ncbi:DUF6263 family protein [Tautonia sociabilis]|uniref:Uncharacterized protein n=1 Tax=Tautonia sociabilis TaxID=2080755 RepID=A0A432MP92_9BACT|nr:DUF6263 family protein [Tautonia sociabilis]RUL89140.1 hypothetical protein TsocGM_03210 [Tautonia sociabilis]
MSRRFAPIPLPLALALLLAGPASGQELLRWKFTEGDSHRFELSQEQVISATVAEQDVSTSTQQSIAMTWDVLSVEEDGSARLSQTIDRVKVLQKTPFVEISYDSAAEAGEEAPSGPSAMLKQVVDALIGFRVVLVMTPRGEVRDVELPEETLERLRSAGPAAAALQNLSTPEGIDRMISQATLVLPERPVEAGASWSRTAELPTPQGELTLTSTFSYEGLQDNLATIGLTLTVDAIRPNADAPFRLEVGDQAGSGSYSFDPALGVLRSSRVSQSLTFLITVMDQQYSSEAESTTTLTLIDP